MKCCDITSGQLNRKVTISNKQNVPDGNGGVTKQWVVLANVWAKIKPRSGGEKLHSDRLDAHGLSTVIMRYRSDINETQKLTYRGQDYQIRSVINIEERDQWLELVIERGVAQ